MNFDTIKMDAKQKVKGKIGILFLIDLIISLITGAATTVLSFIPFNIGSLPCAIFLMPPFAISVFIVYIGVGNGGTPKVEDAFSGFKRYWDAVTVCFFQELFIFLWSLLLIIPGIIKAYAYSMTNYLFVENPGKDWKECMDKSQQMMMGHKKELFLLDLSFIGWFLLGAITLGITLIWTVPYYNVTRFNFYRELKKRDPELSAYMYNGAGYNGNYNSMNGTGYDNPFDDYDDNDNPLN